MGDSRESRGAPWVRITEEVNEVDQLEMHQMCVLPSECNVQLPQYHYRRIRDNHRRIRRTVTTISNHSDDFFGRPAHCHVRLRTKEVALTVVILCVTASVGLCFFYLAREQLSRNGSSPVVSHVTLDPSSNVSAGNLLTTVHPAVSPSLRTETYAEREDHTGIYTTTDGDEASVTQTSLLITSMFQTSTESIGTPTENMQLIECVAIPIRSCQQQLTYNTTNYPNRFNLGMTVMEGAILYRRHLRHVDDQCQRRAEKLLCRIFFPPCFSPLAASDPIPLPCRSYCEDIRENCVTKAEFASTAWDMCRYMPQSGNASICFQSTTLSPAGSQQPQRDRIS